jgi:hypothetical protein
LKVIRHQRATIKFKLYFFLFAALAGAWGYQQDTGNRIA